MRRILFKLFDRWYERRFTRPAERVLRVVKELELPIRAIAERGNLKSLMGLHSFLDDLEERGYVKSASYPSSGVSWHLRRWVSITELGKILLQRIEDANSRRS